MVGIQFSVDDVKFDQNGLIPAIVQDVKTGKVLMLAYMNRESLEKTIETGTTWFWSRSRKELWNKGATSGNIQRVEEIVLDCDNDAILIKVNQEGVACHTGNYTCFYRQNHEVTPYILSEVYKVILERKRTLPEGSYVAKKMKEGLDRILKKIGEEASELIIAAKNQNEKEIIYEMADLIFHSLMVLGYFEIDINKLYEEFESRRR